MIWLKVFEKQHFKTSYIMSFQHFLKQVSLIFIIVAIPLFPAAQEHEHSADSTAHEEESEHSEQVLPTNQEIPGDSESVFAPFSAFPNLHPMVVHFPVVLLLLAFFSQLFGFFGFRVQFSWITLFLLAGGFIGAIFAAQIFHPHAGGLPENVKEIFETHEYYGKTTMWLAAIALLFKIISHFFLKRKVWAEILVFIIISASAITVSLAGHLGSQMVYIEKVGPQGNYIEEHHDESEEH